MFSELLMKKHLLKCMDMMFFIRNQLLQLNYLNTNIMVVPFYWCSQPLRGCYPNLPL